MPIFYFILYLIILIDSLFYIMGNCRGFQFLSVLKHKHKSSNIDQQNTLVYEHNFSIECAATNNAYFTTFLKKIIRSVGTCNTFLLNYLYSNVCVSSGI